MKIFFVGADQGGSSFYRIVTPAGICKELYEDSIWGVAPKLPLKKMYDADIIVVQRQCHLMAANHLKHLKEIGKVVISELDDNLWAIPKDTKTLYKFWTKENVDGLTNIIKNSHAITVSTRTLAKTVKQFNPNVYVLPNLLLFDPDFEKKDMGVIRIGWSGSETHSPDFTPEIADALISVKKKYGDKIELLMSGMVHLSVLGDVSFHKFLPPFEYMDHFRSLGIDIGIIPCRENLFNDSRSNIKFIEYSSSKIATIASYTNPHRESIINRQNGLLVKNTKKTWEQALIELIEKVDFRKQLAENAFKWAYKNFSVQEKKDQYLVYKTIYNNIKGENN